MIDFLVRPDYVGFNLSLPASRQNYGGGIAVKYARCVEAAERYWGGRCVGSLKDIQSDVVFVDWQWFVFDPENWVERVKEFLSLDVKLKVLYGSDLSILKAPMKLRETVLNGAHNLKGVDIVTHNSQYQRNMYTAIGIKNSMLLCDPIPEHIFYPAVKEKRLVCIGQIGWYKRSEMVASLFDLLSDTDIETCYIGGANFWGNIEVSDDDMETQTMIRASADDFVENASTLETAYWVNSSMYYAHVSYHDVSNQAGQENLISGNVCFGLTHPVNRERPFRVSGDIVENIKSYDSSLFDAESESNREFALKHYSYQAWQEQIGKLLRGAA